MSNPAKAALGIATLVTVALAIAAVVSAASTGTSSAASSPDTGRPGGSGPRATAAAAKIADFAHTFSKPGSYPYVCGSHNSMTGTVLVLP